MTRVMGRDLRRGVGLAIVAAMLLAGCGTPAPDWYADRAAMPVCGTFTFDDHVTSNDELAAAVTCLRTAFEAGEPAELTITEPTDEGDPVTSVYQVVGPQRLLVLTDWTRDPFAGSQEYTREECTRLETGETHRPRPASCAPTAGA